MEAQFEGQDFDSIQEDVKERLEACNLAFQHTLKGVRSGRATPTIFDHIQVQAHGTQHPFSDLCTAAVRGQGNIVVSVHDAGLREAVVKALQTSDFELTCQSEGKNIMVRLGQTKDEGKEQLNR